MNEFVREQPQPFRRVRAILLRGKEHVAAERLRTPADVTAVTVSGASKFPQLGDLQAAIDALLPATTNVCTTAQELTVPLKVSGSGAVKRGKGSVKITAEAGALQDKNGLRLSCVPRGWPSQAYNHKNHRSTPVG